MKKNTSSGKRKFLLLVVTGVLLLAACLVFFLPSIISSPWGVKTVQQSLSDRLPGLIKFDRLSLGWTMPVHIEGFVYEDQAAKLAVTAADIQTSKGLLGFLSDHQDLGEITIDSPVVTASRTAGPEKNATTQAGGDKTGEQGTTTPPDPVQPRQASAKSGKTQFSLPAITATIVVKDGAAVMVSDKGNKTPLLQRLNLTSTVSGPQNFLSFSADCYDGDNSGSFRGDGQILFPGSTAAAADASHSMASVVIDNFQIAKILDLVSQINSFPQGSGLLNADFILTGQDIDIAQVKGNFSVDQLNFHGGAIAPDTPSLGTITLDVDAEKKGASYGLNRVLLKSSLGQAVIKGSFGTATDSQIEAALSLDLAQIFRQFPATLKLRPGVIIDTGKIDTTAHVTSSGPATMFDLKTTLQHLKGVADNRAVSWNEPITVVAKGIKDQTGIGLDLFSIDSPFLQGKGHGNNDGMELQLAGDIGKGLTRIARFIDLGGYSGYGSVNVAMKLTAKEKELRTITGDLAIADFTLKRGDTILIPAEEFGASVKADIRLDHSMRFRSADNLALDMTSWLGKTTVTADRIESGSEQKIDSITGLQLQAGLSPFHLTKLLHTFNKLPENMKLVGDKAIGVKLSVAEMGNQKVVGAGLIDGIKLATADGQPVDQRLSLKLDLDQAGDSGNLTVNSFEISSLPATVSGSGTFKEGKGAQAVGGEGILSLDWNQISRLMQNLYNIDLTIKDISTEPFVVRTSSPNGKWNDAIANTEIATSFGVESADGYGVSIKQLTAPVQLKNSLATFDIQGDLNRGRLTLTPSIDFTHSPPLLSFPENSQIVSGAGLTAAMSNDLLAKIHPLFKGAAISSGTVDLNLSYFHWPLDHPAGKDADFKGNLFFHDTKLQAGGILLPLLDAMKAREQQITLGEQAIEFKGKEQRIHCSPLEIKLDEHTIRLSGSVGFDKSLDYQALIPVTRKMVGGDLYKYLEGSFITVPISGTVTKPSINKNFIDTALKDLILQAGKKRISDQAGSILQKLFE
ncbi:AsmA family protein [Desulforhopalus singaporensis]|uniref:AsmA family protein n=1 Tax=Desulforhopalus singaporensis TaxID=91360 RepID=A0A1H0UBV1_9BACT|nr:hypothetical protein [Desulforhopalus singaporensis]SDP63468.1 hypothetical protein SAMN05660330_03475 [Desulforhopalus singaporensis]